ncbi:uncharacterized protein LOC144640546 [Oculina patagonica]
MAAAPDPDEVLRSTTGKSNFQRVARLLISGGTALLREIFDQLCPPSNLPTILKNPAKEKQLKAAKLTKPQWDCLYPAPGVYGKSTDFDVTLLFRLLRTICNLIPPATGWDTLPANTDHSLAADLARIKFYRNSVYGHVSQKMEIKDDEFPQLWQEISDALIRIAAQISSVKKTEWQKAIDNFLNDPLTAEDGRNVEELMSWYRNDMEVKKSVEELNVTTHKGMERLETSLKGAQEAATKEVQGGLERLQTRVQGDLKGSTNVLETAVREEAQEIKDQLGTLHQSLDRLSSSDRNPQAAGARLQLRINCEAISGPGPLDGSSELIVAPQEPQAEIQLQAVATGGSVGGVSNQGALPSSQEVLNLAAFKYLKTIDPSKPEDLNGFVRYLREIRELLIVDTNPGSLIITVECSTLEILDKLWDDYCTGYLNEMAQRFLVTEEILLELALTEVKLTTTILEEEYRACRKYFLQYPVHDPGNTSSKSNTRFHAELIEEEGGSYEVTQEEGIFKSFFVKTRSGKTVITLHFVPDDTIEDVKKKIKDEVGLPTDKQKLIFDDTELKDDRTLRSYHIPKNSTLLLIMIVRLYIKMETGKLITLDVEPETTIEEVKVKIQEEEGIPPNQQRLCLPGFGKQLEDSSTLKDNNIPWNIQRESLLSLMPVPTGGIQILRYR